MNPVLPLRVSRRRAARATMKDIAARLNVHHSTVSLCLRGSDRIRPETRERVRQAAEELGYHRDPLLDTFNQRRVDARPLVMAGAMAMVFDRPLGASPEEDPRSAVLHGARVVAQRFGFAIDVFYVGQAGLSAARLGVVLRSRGVQGVIVAGLSPATANVALQWDKLVGIRVESHHLTAQLDIVTPNHRQAARLAVRHLRMMGYRRIGLALRGDTAATLVQLWRAGHMVELQPSPDTPWVQPYLVRGDADDARRFGEWTRQHALEGIVTNVPAFPELCRDALLAAPGELGWVGLDSTASPPDATAVAVDWGAVGAAAAHAVAIRQRTNQHGLSPAVSVSYIPVSLRVGATTPPRSVPPPP